MLFHARQSMVLLLLWVGIAAFGQHVPQHTAIADKLYDQGIISAHGRDMIYGWTVPIMPLIDQDHQLEKEQMSIMQMCAEAFRAQAVLACYAHVADSLDALYAQSGRPMPADRGEIDEIVDHCCCARPGRTTTYEPRSLEWAKADPEFSILIRYSERSEKALDEKIFSNGIEVPDLIERTFTANAIDGSLRDASHSMVSMGRIKTAWDFFEFAYAHLRDRPAIRENRKKQLAQISELNRSGALSDHQANLLTDTLGQFETHRSYDLVVATTRSLEIPTEIGHDIEEHLKSILRGIAPLHDDLDFSDVLTVIKKDKRRRVLHLRLKNQGRSYSWQIPVDDDPFDERIVPRTPRSMMIGHLNRMLCEHGSAVRIFQFSRYNGSTGGGIQETVLSLMTEEVANVLFPSTHMEQAFLSSCKDLR